MYPILFQFPGFIFYTQTLCLIVAFIAGLMVAGREGRRFAIPQHALTDFVLWSFLCALIGARALFLIFHSGVAALSLRELCTLGTLDGGFALHGGLLSAAAAGIVIARVRHLPLWRTADALAPGLGIAMFFMRLGCLLNGCDYGITTSLPWGIPLHGAMRHPIQLYEGIGNLLLAICLRSLNAKPVKQGQVFLSYIALSSLLRFGVDFYREEYLTTLIWGPLTAPQLIAAALCFLAALSLALKLPQRLLSAAFTSSS